MKTYFQRQIVEKGYVPTGIDARHVEAYVRVAHSTINSLSWAELRREIKISVACIREGGVDAAERVALSFGL